MFDPVGNHFDGQSFCVADRLLARLPVSHHAGEFECFSDPAAVIFPVDLNAKVHASIVRRAALYRGLEGHVSAAAFHSVETS